MDQATTEKPGTGETLYRWWIYTDQGRKSVWRATAEDAEASAEARGLSVERVEPCPADYQLG